MVYTGFRDTWLDRPTSSGPLEDPRSGPQVTNTGRDILGYPSLFSDIQNMQRSLSFVCISDKEVSTVLQTSKEYCSFNMIA